MAIIAAIAAVVFAGRESWAQATGAKDEPKAAANTEAEQDAIKKSFEAYRTALLNANGKAAADVVAEATIKEYEKYRESARFSNADDVRKLALMSRMMVLILRHRVEAEELKKRDGKALFMLGVEKGWIGKDEVTRLEIGEVNVKGNVATATAMHLGRPAPLKWEFRKEDGAWKLNLVATFPIIEKALKAAIPKDQTENDFILLVLELASGKKPEATIWDPLEKR